MFRANQPSTRTAAIQVSIKRNVFFMPQFRIKFQPKTFLRVRHIAIEEPIAPKTEQKIRSSRLQIVVVCPVLLERVRTNPEHAVHLTNHLIPEKVLAMMLGVHDSHINDTYRSSLVSCDQWRKFFVKDQDETFVGELLGAAVAILGTMPPPALRSDKTAFSVHPKKVKLVSLIYYMSIEENSKNVLGLQEIHTRRT